MTQDEIIDMARQAGVDKWWDSGNEQREVLQKHLVVFAKLVAAKEREACAKIFDEFCYGSTKILIERAIRARGEQNFCPRCGKRTNDIHTCTPPRVNT
jgi:hypothetical protein